LIKKDLILKTALKTVEVEIDTLIKLKDNLGENFRKCVFELLKCKGRVVVTGVGKSALVAQKNVATLNSTGTPSLYMHAADAVHGDLGMIVKEDIILCISKSGNTSEIKVLIPVLKNFGNTLIGMTSNENSYLARNVDHVLYLPVDEEAEPNNLAPTASSIAQMAMGDALASALLVQRGFSHKHFAKFHPGGSLGKQLYLRVNQLYSQNEKPLVLQDASIREVIVEMTSKRLGSAVVTDNEEAILGIITDGDLRRMLERKDDVSLIKARDIMSKVPKHIEYDELAVEALKLMRVNSITQIIVVKKGKYDGLVHIHDLIREGIV